MKTKTLVIVSAVLTVVVLGLSVKWDFTGDWEGIYLLSRDRWGFEVTDDLFPEDSDRFLAGISLGNIPGEHHNLSARNSSLHLAWNAAEGRGFIKNVYADGRKLLINLSRFKTVEGTLVSGVFVGGGLPTSDPDYNPADRNETGMAYFDGKRWYHIWCYVNEALSSLANPSAIVGPEHWQFLGSRVIENSSSEFTIQSRHSAVVAGIPLRITKYLFYEAGNSYFTLVTQVSNVGNKPLTLLYMYGDEPWLGDYGSAEGNVGWTKGGLIRTEQFVDTRTNSYAGFFDYGNDLAGEAHDYTLKANFIEWDAASRPESAYFSNFVGHFSLPGVDGHKTPLASRDCRFLGLQWRKTLAPRQAFSFKIAVGLADNNPATGFPVKPHTGLP
jgi:hypothetical protein